MGLPDSATDGTSSDTGPSDVAEDSVDTDHSADSNDANVGEDSGDPDARDQSPDVPDDSALPYTMRGTVFNNMGEDSVEGDPRAGRLWVIVFSEPFNADEGTFPDSEPVAFVDLGLKNEFSWLNAGIPGVDFEVSGVGELGTSVYPVAVLKRDDGADDLDFATDLTLTAADLVGSLLGGDALGPERENFNGRTLEVCAPDDDGLHTRCHFGGD